EHNLDAFKRDYGTISNLMYRLENSVTRLGSGYANMLESAYDIQNELGRNIGVFNPQAVFGKQFLSETRRNYDILKDAESDKYMKPLSVDDIKNPSDLMNWLLNDVAGE